MKGALAAVALLGGSLYGQGPGYLALKGRIALGNVSGRIDHLSADTRGHRLFVAALGNHTVEVLDIQNGKRVHTIGGLAEPQGVLYEASTGRLFVASGGDGSVKVFDGRTFQLLHTAQFPGDADNLRAGIGGSQIIVGYGEGGLGLLDSNGKKAGEIALDAHPESFQLQGARVFVNVPDRKEIEVADLSSMSVIARWPVTSALRNFPMALDRAHHRLLIGCRAPARMLVIDTGSGKQTARVDIAGDADDLFYDAAGKRVYVIGGQGFVDVFTQKDPDRYDRVQRVATAPGARTGLFVPDWETLFVAVPRRGGQRAEVLVYQAH